MRTSNFLGSFRPKLQRKEGFTLFEVLIVIGIISILATILLGYTRHNSEQLIQASLISKMEALISRAKLVSIQTFFEENDGTICAHGVEVDRESDTMRVFQVLRGGGATDCPDTEDLTCADYECYTESNFEFAYLEGDLYRLSFGEGGSVSLGGDLEYVVFIPPDPGVNIVTDSGIRNSGYVSIDVGDLDPVGVTVRKNGQIETN